MRILILTHSKERHYFLCNSIIEKTNSVVGVITGAKVVNRGRYENLKRKLKNFRFYIKNRVLNMVKNF